MAQKDILDFLKENKNEWLTTKEIQYRMNKSNISSITSNLKKLREVGMIKFKKQDMEGRTGVTAYLYKHKER